nr:MAG TPA: hypothetical protein [Caudoviricetes sp.]
MENSRRRRSSGRVPLRRKSGISIDGGLPLGLRPHGNGRGHRQCGKSSQNVLRRLPSAAPYRINADRRLSRRLWLCRRTWKSVRRIKKFFLFGSFGILGQPWAAGKLRVERTEV